MFNQFLALLLLLNFEISRIDAIDFCPNYGPYCNCPASISIITCSGFDSFSQLDFNKGSINNTFYELDLNPKTKLFLDNTLNLEGIVVTNHVKLYQIKGFVFAENPFILNEKNLKDILLHSNSNNKPV